MTMRYSKKITAGFTVVELLVAMAVFASLITISSGVFIRSLRTQRVIVALIAANSNAGLAMEQMMREIRTGSGFSTNQSSLTFTNAKGQMVIYRWNDTPTVRAIERSTDNINFKKITASNVKVYNLRFELFKGSPADPYPVRVTLVMQIGATNNISDNPVVNIQTTVSARTLE